MVDGSNNHNNTREKARHPSQDNIRLLGQHSPIKSTGNMTGVDLSPHLAKLEGLYVDMMRVSLKDDGPQSFHLPDFGVAAIARWKGVRQ